MGMALSQVKSTETQLLPTGPGFFPSLQSTEEPQKVQQAELSWPWEVKSEVGRRKEGAVGEQEKPSCSCQGK